MVGEIPIFYKRCELTRQLFNVVVEIRPSTTSAGLVEQLKREFLPVGLSSNGSG